MAGLVVQRGETCYMSILVALEALQDALCSVVLANKP